jgi:hypothetical protein
VIRPQHLAIVTLVPVTHPGATFASLANIRATAAVLLGATVVAIAVSTFLHDAYPRLGRAGDAPLRTGFARVARPRFSRPQRSTRPGASGPHNDRKVPAMPALPKPTAGNPAGGPPVFGEAGPPQ